MCDGHKSAIIARVTVWKFIHWLELYYESVAPSKLELFLLVKLFNWLERRFGFGRGCSCTGVGCGFVLLIIAILVACSIITRTNWLRLF